mgnify:CR=1 FL=1
MRTDILDLHRFYESPLGTAARDFIAARLAEAWGDAARLRVAGFGYASPFLGAFDAAERALHLAPMTGASSSWRPIAGDCGR